MSALTEMEDRVEMLLGDISSPFWSTAKIDEYVKLALNEMSMARPEPKEVTKATTNGSYEITLDISTFPNLVSVYAVEFQLSKEPRLYRRFSMYTDRLTLWDVKGDGNNCKILWGKKHAADCTTLLPIDSEGVAYGAAWIAARAFTSTLANASNIAGRSAYSNWSRETDNLQREWNRYLASRKLVRWENDWEPPRELYNVFS